MNLLRWLYTQYAQSFFNKLDFFKYQQETKLD